MSPTPSILYLIDICTKLENLLDPGVQNDASARPPNLSSASCDLDL